VNRRLIRPIAQIRKCFVPFVRSLLQRH